MKSIKKRILSGLIVGLFMIIPNGKCEFKGINDKIKVTNELELYTGYELNSKMICNVKINKNIEKILTNGKYDLVNYENILGFARSNLLENNAKYNDLTYEEFNKFGVTLDEVNLRSYPNIDDNILFTIDKNTILKIILKSSNGWYLVLHNNSLGFISSKYIKIIDKEKLNEEMLNMPKIYECVIAKTDVNIRSKPNINSDKIGLLKKNKKLLVSNILNDWIEVIYDDKIGYIKSEYVKKIYVINKEPYKHIFIVNESFVYDAPYSNVIGVLPKYESAFVYDEIEDFYLIESEGRVGYIYKNNTNELNGNYLIVDISSQKIIYYNEMNEILISDVVTGKQETPTDLGYFKINSKELDRILVGKDYKSFVNYWIGYNKGEGIHDASWRTDFGEDIYLTKGSHGCVNLPIINAKKLYYKVSIGDKVLVKK